MQQGPGSAQAVADVATRAKLPEQTRRLSNHKLAGTCAIFIVLFAL